MSIGFIEICCHNKLFKSASFLLIRVVSGNVGGSEVSYGFVTCNKSNRYRPKQTMIILIEVRGDGKDDGLGKKGGDNEELLTPVSRMGMVVA